ncbi:MAG: helix-turn-helix transcriptional regulator [Chloroflexota bacterium]
MEGTDRRERLGRFLRSCRERTTPQDVGIATSSRRRTPGLRREEVAGLAGISPAYYTKIEQGRVDVSPHVLNTLAGIFDLTHTEREYVFALARDYISDDAQPAPEEATPELELLLASLEPYPAQILGRYWNILAWNQATTVIMHDFAALPPEARNLIMGMFLSPELRQLIGDWEGNAQRMLAEFRADLGRYHHDPVFGEMVTFRGPTARSSPSGGWSSPESARRATHPGSHHPSGETLYLQEMVFDIHDHPSMRLIMFIPQDEANKQKLQRLVDNY